MHRRPRWTGLVVAVVVALGAACSGGGDDTVPEAPAGTPTVVSSTADGSATSAIDTTATSPASVVSVATTRAPRTRTALQCVAHLPRRVRVGQVVWPALYSDRLGDGDTYARWGVGGVVLMDWSGDASADALASFRSRSSIPLLVATDEEGGTVQRLRTLGVIPSQSTVAATMTPDQARTMIRRHATQVHELGIDVVFAPVADVAPVSGTGPLGSRTFSSDPAVVTQYARAYVRAWKVAGVLPVLKHFPGHGAASADSHDGRAQTAPLDVLRTRDLVPYVELVRGHTGVMVGHLDVPGLTDVSGVPASLSRAAVTGLLRRELGYGRALVFSDALGMTAITSLMSVPDAAVRTLRAGVDVAIFTDVAATPAVIGRIMSAVRTGELSRGRLNRAVLRVLRAKDIDPCALVPG